MAETRCRSCNEAIRFERTAAGRLAPISLKTGESHFIDCPDRREWRKQPVQGALFADDEPGTAPKPADRRYPT